MANTDVKQTNWKFEMATPDQAHWAFLSCWEELHPAPLRRHEVLQLYWLSLKFAFLCLTPRIYIVSFFNLPLDVFDCTQC